MQTTTNSIAFPNMFDLARNRVAVKTGDTSIVNRTRLLILTEPTELYNEPTFGVGLKRYLWQYNTPNVKALIQDRIKAQLSEHEPCVEAENTVFSDGLLYTGTSTDPSEINSGNELSMTVGLKTIYEDDLTVTIDLEEERKKMFGSEG